MQLYILVKLKYPQKNDFAFKYKKKIKYHRLHYKNEYKKLKYSYHN